jgi:CheY-like chemotaxis protein
MTHGKTALRSGQTAMSTSGREGPARARPRVLYIDDEVLMGRVVGRVLDDYDVVIAKDGETGLELWVREGPFDLVLCDMVLPGIDGMEVHRRLSAISPHAAGKMLFLTAGTASREGQVFLENMKGRVLLKPYSAIALQIEVMETLRR